MRIRDEQKEQKVREKALELLVELGFDGFSMQKLAKAAGVSPATLYIYFNDKEDLILSLGEEIGQEMVEATFKGFDKNMDLETGLWIQWKNRSDFHISHQLKAKFYDLNRLSPYHEKLKEGISGRFKEEMGGFIKKAIHSGEMVEHLKPEIFWSIAFAPLFNLIRFHVDIRSMTGMPYELTEDDMRTAFSLVIKALKK